MDKIKAWLADKFFNLAFVWGLSFFLMYSTTRNLRLAFGTFLITSILSFQHQWFKEVLLVSFMTLLPLGLVFIGVDVFLSAIIFALVAGIMTILVKTDVLPKYFSASLYVPVLAITLVIGQTL